MALIIGLFSDSDHAGQAVSELKQKGYTNDISVIAKDESSEEIKAHDVKQSTADGAASGAAIGGVMGGITGLLAGLSSVALPGIGTVLVAGPLAATWGLVGGAAGMLSGGLIGALVDAGIPEEEAREYEHALQAGEVLVVVSADESKTTAVHQIMDKHNVDTTQTQHSAL